MTFCRDVYVSIMSRPGSDSHDPTRERQTLHMFIHMQDDPHAVATRHMAINRKVARKAEL